MTTVPLLEPHNPDDDLQMEGKHGLKNLRPWYVDEHNCGSKIGLLEMITQTVKNSLPLLAKSIYPVVRLDVKTQLGWMHVRYYFESTLVECVLITYTDE